MTGVLGLRNAARVFPRRRPPGRRRRLPPEGLMGPLAVVLGAPGMEAALLTSGRARGRPGRLGLERSMHPLVGPVLLRVTRLDALVRDPKAHPPDIERGKAVDSRRGEGNPIVGTDRPGKSHLPKQA